jgi:hypothetical protein
VAADYAPIQALLEAPGGVKIGSGLLEPLGELRQAVQVADARLEPVAAQLASIGDRRLLGPVSDAYETVADRLPELQDRIGGIEGGLGALMAFAGSSGPRQYLFLSQNPDEVRPTGGFIGTYGVLAAADGEISLERYDAIESWYRAHPDAVVPPEEAPTAFQIPDPPVAQTIANVNDLPDWSKAGQLAASRGNGAGRSRSTASCRSRRSSWPESSASSARWRFPSTPRR